MPPERPAPTSFTCDSPAGRPDLLRRGLLWCGCALAAGGWRALPASAEDASTAPLPLREVADGVYAVQGINDEPSEANGNAIANLGAIVGEEAALVIDSGGSRREAERFIKALQAVTDRPLRTVVNTHMHPDHIFGNGAFKDLGAEIIGHRNLPRALDSRRDTYLASYRQQIGDALMEGVAVIAPDRVVDDTLTVDLGRRRVTLKAWQAAHTDNDLTAFDERSRTLFAGDLVFLGHIPIIDGSLLGWLRQMDILAALPARQIMPGHGPVPTAWPAGLADQRRYLETLATDIRASIAAGERLQDAVETAARSEKDRWALFDVFNGRNATAAFAELEWE